MTPEGEWAMAKQAGKGRGGKIRDLPEKPVTSEQATSVAGGATKSKYFQKAGRFGRKGVRESNPSRER
jgi:hypothetical protein